MANTVLPAEERDLSPAQMDQLDRRRRRGQLLLVMGTQFLLIAILVTLWAGQDATYSPGWAHPMLYWDILLFVLAADLLRVGSQAAARASTSSLAIERQAEQYLRISAFSAASFGSPIAFGVGGGLRVLLRACYCDFVARRSTWSLRLRGWARLRR